MWHWQWARAAELLSGEEEDISWGPLKRESRAIEKVRPRSVLAQAGPVMVECRSDGAGVGEEQAFRCYGGDVSRLLDLSRHSIVFEEPEQML
eukprot:2494014-Rhodomonas_salina.1